MNLIKEAEGSLRTKPVLAFLNGRTPRQRRFWSIGTPESGPLRRHQLVPTSTANELKAIVANHESDVNNMQIVSILNLTFTKSSGT